MYERYNKGIKIITTSLFIYFTIYLILRGPPNHTTYADIRAAYYENQREMSNAIVLETNKMDKTFVYKGWGTRRDKVLLLIELNIVNNNEKPFLFDIYELKLKDENGRIYRPIGSGLGLLTTAPSDFPEAIPLTQEIPSKGKISGIAFFEVDKGTATYRLIHYNANVSIGPIKTPEQNVSGRLMDLILNKTRVFPTHPITMEYVMYSVKNEGNTLLRTNVLGIIKRDGEEVYRRYEDLAPNVLPGEADQSYWHIYDDISEPGNYSITISLFEEGVYDDKSDDLLLDNQTIYTTL